MSNNRNQKAAIIALIAVIVLIIVAAFLIVHLVKDADFSSVRLPSLPWSESSSPTQRPQSTFDLTPPSVPVPSLQPSSTPALFSRPTPSPSPSPDPLSGFDTVFFGTYKDSPIEWIVLESQENRQLQKTAPEDRFPWRGLLKKSPRLSPAA